MTNRRSGEFERQRRDFDRAMVRSAELLGDVLSNVAPPSDRDDYLVYELGRLVEEGAVSFDNPDFRFLIEQGVRLEYDSDIEFRSRLVECLRRNRHGLDKSALRVTQHVIAAIEDTDFPLQKIGVIIHHYARNLFSALEVRDERSFSDLEETIDRLFDSSADSQTASDAIAHISELATDSTHTPRDRFVAARALAFAVSEPLLAEAQEAEACRVLPDIWLSARVYLLYNLRKHTHEDIPFRWMELLVDAGELRAVDRILEEVLIHASDADYREDLMTCLDLLDRSSDPGKAGKTLRILAGPDSPAAARRVIETWIENSPAAAFLEGATERTGCDFVHLTEDFSTFASRLRGLDTADVWVRWNEAYHESLGWQRRSALPRSERELQLERRIQASLADRFSGARPDEAALRDAVESLRETCLDSPNGETTLLVTVYRERPVNNGWLRDIYLREINGIYVRTAQAYDRGDTEEAQRSLRVLLEIEPEYPFALSLERVMRDQKSLHDLK